MQITKSTRFTENLTQYLWFTLRENLLAEAFMQHDSKPASKRWSSARKLCVYKVLGTAVEKQRWTIT